MQHKAILTTVLESGGTAATRQPGQGASPGGGVPGEGEAGDHGGGRGRSEPRTERSHWLSSTGQPRTERATSGPAPALDRTQDLAILRDCDRYHGSCPPINNADTQHYKTRYIIHLPRQNVQHEVSNLEEITWKCQSSNGWIATLG